MTERNTRLNRILVEAEHHTVREMWQFRKELRQPILERTAKVALGAVLQPAPVRDYLRTKCNADENLPGYRYIGGGYQQRAFKCGKEVLKLLDNTTGHEGLSLEQIAAKLQGYSDKCEQEVDDQIIAWTPTQFDVVTLPVSKDRKVVARQPYVEPTTSYFDMDELAGDPVVPSETKRAFAGEVARVHQATGLYIDIRGAGNIMRVPNRYAVIDTIPVDAAGHAGNAGNDLTIEEDIQMKLEQIESVHNIMVGV